MISNTYKPAKNGIHSQHLADGSCLLRDDILNFECRIQPDIYCDVRRSVQAAEDRLYYERRRIIDAFWAFFPPACGGWGNYRPRFHLLGDDIGPRVLEIVKRISDVECHICSYDFGKAYNASAKYLLENKDTSYSQYKMRMEISGEQNIYTLEEFTLVHIMLDCTRELLSRFHVPRYEMPSIFTNN